MNPLNRLMKSVDEISDEIVTFTRALVQARTENPPGLDTGCAALVEEKIKEADFDFRTIRSEGRSNLFGVVKGLEEGPNLLFNGHMDVVPAGDYSTWRYDPYEAKVVDDMIVGRGACDMKGGLASMIMSCLAIKRSRLSLKGNLILTSVSDEETGGKHGTGALVKSGLLRADMAVVGEPTALRVDVAHKGIVWLEITTRGKAAHGSRPWLGVNAIERMKMVMNLLSEYEGGLKSKSHPLLGSPSLNIGTISGGTKVNIVPDTCRIELDRRILPSENEDSVLGEIRDLLDKRLQFETEITVKDSRRAIETSPEQPIVAHILNACRTVTGSECKTGGKHGATDASYLVHELKIPTAIFGPGNPELAHTTNEAISIKEILQATKIYAITSYLALH